ncbi:GNAT family N-acetyltransferase [Sphingobacterium sp. Mn56C]|uniref:GNAT family N-acetyltransferase n=1 Tax=Sphingobacterium sp. Mn56C TaxID=3395261 RepID=UPI003BC8B6D5
MIIKHEVDTSKGAVYALENDKKIGEMTYSVAGPNKIIIDHTEVDTAQKGMGIGKILLEWLVGYARDNSIKIIPLCPFAKAMFDKDVDIRDVLA